MNEHATMTDYSAGYGLSAQERNKVLRNTYGLLALSMVPTVLGAWMGVEFGLGQIFWA